MPKKLEPFETSIDTSSVKSLRGGMKMETWRINLGGIVSKHQTTGKSAREVRAKAYEQAEELKRQYLGTWRDSDPNKKMRDYLLGRGMEEVANAGTEKSIRERTVYINQRYLKKFAELVGDMTIKQCSQPQMVEILLNKYADLHGHDSAVHCKAVLSKYVYSRLVFHGVVERDPTVGKMRLNQVKKSRSTLDHGIALGEDTRQRVIAWLVSYDVSRIQAWGKYSALERQRGQQSLVDITLMQCCTGMRVGEVVHLMTSDVDVSGDAVIVTVRPEVSKTRKGRAIPVFDEQCKDMLQRRTNGVKTNVPVFPVGTDATKTWSDGDLSKRMRKLYDQMADDLGVEELKHVASHVWRATLTTTLKSKGLSPAVIAAYLGHSQDVSERFYTDGIDLAALAEQLGEQTTGKVIKFRTA